jgi:hypothetical protein
MHGPAGRPLPVSERPEPNIDRVREALRRHDERSDPGGEEEENGEPAPAERPEDEEEAES